MKKIIYKLWPPLELFSVDEKLQDIDFSDRWAQATKELEYTPNDGAEILTHENAEKISTHAYEAEIKRKEVLEGKASSFILAPSIATTFVATISPMIKELSTSPLILTVLIAVLYLLSLVNFLASTHYAIRVRQVSGFVLLSAKNAHELIHQSPSDRITQRLVSSRLNEPALLKKSNFLSVAEDLFLNGLGLLAAASCFYVVGFILKMIRS